MNPFELISNISSILFETDMNNRFWIDEKPDTLKQFF